MSAHSTLSSKALDEKKTRKDIVSDYAELAYLAIISAFLYLVLMGMHILPRLQILVPADVRDSHILGQALVECFFFHVFAVLFAVSAYRTSITDPGEVPVGAGVGERYHNFLEEPSPNIAEERLEDGRARFCGRTGIFKPDRTHFCRQMHRNVLLMDHYCVWLKACIGYENRKFFFLTLLYGAIACDMAACSLIKQLIEDIDDVSVQYGMIVITAVGAILSTFIGVALSAFCGFHLYLIATNKTTIEFVEIYTSDDKVNPYDHGVVENVVQVLGDDIFRMLLPTPLREDEKEKTSYGCFWARAKDPEHLQLTGE